MKKRIALIALSAVLVFSLTIGGTLMLFTAQSEKATNVVTMGKASIELWEKFGKAELDSDGEITNFDTISYEKVGPNSVYDLSNIKPGDTIIKAPKVKNTGSTGVYLYVEVKVTAEGNWSTDDLKELALTEFTHSDEKDWWGINIIPQSDGKSFVGGFFYWDRPVGDSDGPLGILAPNNETPNVFDTLELDLGLEPPNNAKLQMEVKAYALQADNNPITDADGNLVTTISVWKSTFKSAFPTELSYF
jgi:predicted ribosomally synthesized peptide with SipW-like signal peptide